MFVPAIDAVPDRFEVDGPEPHYEVIVPLAVSDDGRREVALVVLLIPFERDGVAMHEFQFAIGVSGAEADEPFFTYDRDMARGYIPEAVRPLVAPCACGALEALFAAVQPELIYRVTYATRPPVKSLSKHQMITDTLIQLGLTVQDEGTDSLGRQFWVMGKEGDGHD